MALTAVQSEKALGRGLSLLPPRGGVAARHAERFLTFMFLVFGGIVVTQVVSGSRGFGKGGSIGQFQLPLWGVILCSLLRI